MFSCPTWRKWRIGFTKAEVLLGERNEGEGAREQVGMEESKLSMKGNEGVWYTVKMWIGGFSGTNYLPE